MKWVLTKNSEKEVCFIEELINFIKNLKIDLILDNNVLEETVNSLATNVDDIWHKHSRKANITKYSKAWWDDKYWKDLDKYRQSKWLEN